MPRISSFYGIVIYLELIAGGLPRRAQKLVTEWAKEHQEELRENWNLAREHQPPHPIDPLG